MRGILFDLDGTLFDTADLILASFRHTLRVHERREASDEELRPYLSMTLADVFRAKGSAAQAMIDTYRAYHFTYFEDTLHLFPGVLEALTDLCEKGCKLAAVTSRRTSSARRGLEITGALPYFSSIVGNDRSEKHKPDPEPLHLAMRELALVPVQCVMVGDSANDLLAGKNAGAKTAAVRWTRANWQEIAAEKPNYIFEKPEDFRRLAV